MPFELTDTVMCGLRGNRRCLHYAALHGHGEVADYLLQKARDRNLASRCANFHIVSKCCVLCKAFQWCVVAAHCRSMKLPLRRLTAHTNQLQFFFGSGSLACIRAASAAEARSAILRSLSS
jgi:hypothetical protein